MLHEDAAHSFTCHNYNMSTRLEAALSLQAKSRVEPTKPVLEQSY